MLITCFQIGEPGEIGFAGLKGEKGYAGLDGPKGEQGLCPPENLVAGQKGLSSLMLYPILSSFAM